ncbi:MAG TPA: class I SAM-dependent methyltransferase [Patescibacteria group bacterium]|nr:class I SAM-dependent methyltransferase [Patescibacteria group bacterium]
MPDKSAVARTIQTYEQTAANYHKTHFDINEIKDIADFFIQNLKGQKILDIGCGPGRDVKYFAEQNLKVIGIDLTANFVKIASQNVSNAKFIQTDMRKLDFQDSSFDGIWACASFFHIPKKDAKNALLGFRRVLKSSGLMFISIKAGTGEGSIQKEEDGGRTKFYALYTEDEFKNLIESCDFKILNMIIKKEKDIDNVQIENTWINIFATKK